MQACSCPEPHPSRRIVLTGGPGAGKTAVLELIRRAFCRHITVLPEAAGILFSGGFPRGTQDADRRATQRAIFYVQRELERGTEALPAIVLCDRGTPDGMAYWPGPGTLWEAVGTTQAEQMGQYDAVIHLRSPRQDQGYNQLNRLRIESADEAEAIDERIAQVWACHPRRHIVASTPDFISKAAEAIRILCEELPPCCRKHIIPARRLQE